jgi:hypothetical protein
MMYESSGKLARAAIIYCIVVLSGCSSIPRPDSKNDTLLVIPVTVENTTKYEWSISFNYKICIERNNAEHWIVVRPSSRFEVYHGLEPGTYHVTKLMSGNGDKKLYTFKRPGDIEILPGKLKVFPWTLMIRLYQDNKGLYEGIDFEEMNLKSKTAFYDELAKIDDFGLWEFDFE